MDAVVDHDGALRFDQAVRQQLCARGLTVAGHTRRAFEARENLLRYRTEEERTTRLRAVQETLKSVQVMTGDDRSFRRQLMDELSVAVIYDVKEIELRASGRNYARVVAKAIEQPVEVKELAGRCRGARQAAAHRRANLFDRERLGMIVSKLREQHLSDQIHARPVLFQHVADDCEAWHTH